MKKLLNLLPLLLLCSCMTLSKSSSEPELEVKTEPIQAGVEEVKTEAVAPAGTEVIDLQTEEELAPPPAKPIVLIKTSLGDIKVELDKEKAPLTVKNFLNYVDKKYYDGTIFHRVISNFMIQGGGMDAKMQQKPTEASIKNEAFNGLSNARGTIAMARTGVVDSATSQFFINVKNNTFLDHKDKSAQRFGYCVFGEVIDGMDVVDKIKKVKTGTRGYSRDVPVENVFIKSIVEVKK